MMKTIFKTIFALGLMVSTQVSMADFAACPSAATAQAYLNSAAANLKEQISQILGWHFFQATADDKFTKVDYYTQVLPRDNLGDHVKYLATFMQGDAATPVDLPAGASTVRHCYYPIATGSLDANANPVVPSIIVLGLEGKAQVLALEYAAGSRPSPVTPTTNISVKVTLNFPVSAPATVNQYTVSLINPTPISGQPSTFTGSSTNSTGLTINNVPVSASGAAYTYNYQATGIAFGGQNYCATASTVDLSTSSPNLNITYSACSAPPPPAGKGKIYAYYTNWSVYARNFTPEKIPYDSIDLVLYAFEQVGPCGGRNGQPSHDCPNGTQDYKLHTTDSWADYQKPMPDGTVGALPNVINLAHAKGKEVAVSIGGYSLSDQLTDLMNDTVIPGCTSNGVQIPASSPTIRKAFIDSMWSGPDPMLTKYKFDGIDIDFEPNGNHWGTESLPGTCYRPITDQIIQNYAQFLVDVKAELTKRQPGRDKLTIALTANPDDVKRIADVTCAAPQGGNESCLSKIANAADTINVMTYDYHGAFDAPGGLTNFSAALHADDQEPVNVPNRGKFNIDATIKAYEEAKVPMSKIVLGIPAYVRLESGVTPPGPVTAMPSLYAQFTGAPLGEWGDETGVWDYKCAMAFFGNKFGIAPMPAAGNPFCELSRASGYQDYVNNLYLRKNSNGDLVGLAAYTTSGNTFFSFDSVGDSSIDTLTPKINYVIDKGINGVMFWEVSGDINRSEFPNQYQKYSLIYNANQQLNGTTAKK